MLKTLWKVVQVLLMLLVLLSLPILWMKYEDQGL